MKKRVTSCFMAFITILTSAFLLFSVLPVSAVAQRDLLSAYEAANKLNSLGLFKGTGTDASGKPRYELERKPTRTEALVMLIRTLGKESATLSRNYAHPFTDVPSWADKYVGYAYENGLSNGVSGTLFGAEDTAEGYTYLTFILRALGYSDAGGADFLWNNPFDLARKIGILPDGVDTNTFLRADVAMVSYAGLSAKLKNNDKTLIETLISNGAVDVSAADAAGFKVMDAHSDAFNYEQDDNFVNSGMMAWDKNVCYFVYAEQYVMNNSIVKEYNIVRKNNDGSRDILYTADVGARISKLSLHQDKLYFVEDSPGDVANAFGKLMEINPETGKAGVIFKSSTLSYYTWYDGVFYVLYTNGNFLSGSYSFASVGSNGVNFTILSGLTWRDTTSFRAYGQNGKLYIVKYGGSSGEKLLIEYDLSKKSSTVLLSEGMTNILFYGNKFYYSNFDKAKEGIFTLWCIKLDAPSERVAVGNLPQAGELYIHNLKFYFRSYQLGKLLSMDMEGNVEVFKPHLEPDSAVCFFGQYALLPTDGLIISSHCDADIMDLNTGELIPYGAYLGFTFWREGTPFGPGENKVWHEEVSEPTSTPHGKALRLYFAKDGLVIEYALVNPTTKTVKFRAMDWLVTCKGCDPIQFATFIDVDVAPNSEYVFSMVFPEVPISNLTESGLNYKVQLRFD